MTRKTGVMIMVSFQTRETANGRKDERTASHSLKRKGMYQNDGIMRVATRGKGPLLLYMCCDSGIAGRVLYILVCVSYPAPEDTSVALSDRRTAGNERAGISRDSPMSSDLHPSSYMEILLAIRPQKF